MTDSFFASREQVLGAAQAITDVVDSRASMPFADDSGEYDVTHLPVETPSVISGKLAVHLRLARARSGRLAAVATYYGDEACQGLPLRHITLAHDGESQGIFDGGIDANPYRPPATHIVDLSADISSAIL